jgi:hypothetical protein
MAGTETAESWLQQILHPGAIPPEALSGGLTPEMAWETWAAGEPARSSAEAWWHDRFDRAHQQERGAQLGRHQSEAARVEAEREAGG